MLKKLLSLVLLIDKMKSANITPFPTVFMKDAAVKVQTHSLTHSLTHVLTN